MIPTLLVALALLLLLGVPVAFAIGLSGMAALVAEGQLPFALVPQRAFAALNSWALMAVPLFIFAGELMNACGISRRAVAVVGRMRGGLPIVSVLASMFFASISGSSSASTAAVGTMMVPAMRRRGYPAGFAAALAAAGGALGPIIPPSIIMIVMGYVTGTSIAALFTGGIVPGVLMAGALIAVSARRARAHEPAAGGEPGDARRFRRVLLEALPAILMPVVVLGGILAGVFTATEAAGVAVAYGLAIGFFVYRELRLGDLRALLVNAALRSCVVLFVATSAFLFAWLIAAGRVPDRLGGEIEALTGSALSFLLVANLILIVVGMFMESISAIIVIMPILFPLALSMGVDPIHFGVLASVNFCIGMVTPPYGATLFVSCTIAGRSIGEVARWTVRPVAAMVAVLALITAFPEVVLFLPRWLGMA